MLGNRPLGIVCTAILGTVALMGANVANAVIDVDSETHTTIEYARESLLTPELQPTADGPKYCLVNNTMDTNVPDSPLEIVVDMDICRYRRGIGLRPRRLDAHDIRPWS